MGFLFLKQAFCLALAVLEPALQTRLASNSVILLNAGIKGVHLIHSMELCFFN